MMQNDVVKQDVFPSTLGFWFESFFQVNLAGVWKWTLVSQALFLAIFVDHYVVKWGRILLINGLLLLKQGRHYKQRIYVHSHKIQFSKTTKWIIRTNSLFSLWASISAWFTDTLRLQNQRKNVPQFPFDHFSIRVHNKLLDKYTVKFLLSTWRLLFPAGKLVSVVLFHSELTLCVTSNKLVSCQKLAITKKSPKKKRKIRFWR